MMPRWWEAIALWALIGFSVVGLLRPRPRKERPRAHTVSHVRRVPPPEPRVRVREEPPAESVIAGGDEWELALLRHFQRQQRARTWEPGRD